MTTTHPSANDSGLNLDHLEALADAMPEHLRLKGWYVAAPSFGQQHVYADNFKGQGRQHIASLPAHKTYFAGLAEFIAAFGPATVKQLIALARRAALANQPAPTVPDDLSALLSEDARVAILKAIYRAFPSSLKEVPKYVIEQTIWNTEQACRAKVSLPHQPAQEQAGTTRVTETKRAQLEARGYEVVGYVMQNSVNELCTLAHGRVEWLGKPAQAAQQEPVAAPQQGFGQEVTRLVGEIRKAGSREIYESAVDDLIDFIDPAPAILSPLCGAQHAESGKEPRFGSAEVEQDARDQIDAMQKGGESND